MGVIYHYWMQYRLWHTRRLLVFQSQFVRLTCTVGNCCESENQLLVKGGVWDKMCTLDLSAKTQNSFFITFLSLLICGAIRIRTYLQRIIGDWLGRDSIKQSAGKSKYVEVVPALHTILTPLICKITRKQQLQHNISTMIGNLLARSGLRAATQTVTRTQR